MIAALLLLSQNSKVTLEMPVAPLSVVLQKIGEKVGEKLVCRGGTQDDFVFVSVKDMDKEVLLSRIAEICEAKWVRTGDERALTAAPTSDDPYYDEFATTLRLYMNRIGQPVMPSDADLKALVADYQKKNPNSLIWKEQRALINRTPGSTAMRHLIKMIGENELRKMKEGERIVWTSNPTKMQRAFPNGAREILATHLAQTKALNSALQETDLFKDQMARFHETIVPLMDAEKVVDFIFTAVRESQGITFQLSGIDAEGRYVCRQRESTANFYYELEQKELMKSFETLLKFNQPLAMSAENRALSNQVHEAKGQILTARPLVVSPELQQRLTDIDKFEPLAGVMTDTMKQLAGLKGNVVALIPDSYQSPIPDIEANKNPPTVGDFLMGYFISPQVPTAEPKIVEKDGIWSISPFSVSGSRAKRLPRKAGAIAFRGLKDPKLDPLDVLAELSKSIKSKGPIEFMNALIDWTSTNGFSTVGQDWAVVQFYSEMSPAARLAARNGGSNLPRAALSQKQKDIMSRALFSEMALAQPGAERAPNVFYVGGGAKDDPSYVFPNGLPLDIPVSFKVEKSSVLYGVSTQAQTWGVRKTDIDEIVRTMVDKEKGNFVHDEPQDRFKHSSTLTALLRIGSDKTPSQSLFFTSESLNFASQWMTMDTLPADVKNAFEKALAERREMMKNVNGGGVGGGRVIPPR